MLFNTFIKVYKRYANLYISAYANNYYSNMLLRAKNEGFKEKPSIKKKYNIKLN